MRELLIIYMHGNIYVKYSTSSNTNGNEVDYAKHSISNTTYVNNNADETLYVRFPSVCLLNNGLIKKLS